MEEGKGKGRETGNHGEGKGGTKGVSNGVRPTGCEHLARAHTHTHHTPRVHTHTHHTYTSHARTHITPCQKGRGGTHRLEPTPPTLPHPPHRSPTHPPISYPLPGRSPPPSTRRHRQHTYVTPGIRAGSSRGGSKRSSTRTMNPRSRRWRTVARPKNPSPPVTHTVKGVSSRPAPRDDDLRRGERRVERRGELLRLLRAPRPCLRVGSPTSPVSSSAWPAVPAGRSQNVAESESATRRRGFGEHRRRRT